jgi:epoxyqueuosine reductase QueG
MNIEEFFSDNNIDDFAILDVSKTDTREKLNLNNLLPNSNSLIIFAKQIPDFVFLVNKKLKTYYLHSLIKEMDKIAYDFSAMLNKDGFNTLPVPCFFPVELKNGILKGYISLKHLAEKAGMGSIGLNTLLISEKYGNRLCLSAIITEKDYKARNVKPKELLCYNCKKCIDSCPSKAIRNGNVEIKKCINFNNQIPGFIRPFINIFMKWNFSKKFIEIIINTLSWNIEMICSECLINCPYFRIPKNNKPSNMIS